MSKKIKIINIRVPETWIKVLKKQLIKEIESTGNPSYSMSDLFRDAVAEKYPKVKNYKEDKK